MPYMDQEVQRTLDFFRESPPPQIGFLSPDVAKAWTISASFAPYNLVPTALVLAPQLTPWRNMLPREQGKGLKIEFKAVTGFNSTNQLALVAEGSLSNAVTTPTEDITATYYSLGLSDSVTYETQFAGKGFFDAKALAVVNLLRATMIGEESLLGFGQNSGTAAAASFQPGPAGTSPKATFALSGSDGSITAATFWIRQTVVTGMGESLPSTVTPIGDVNVGSTNHITITPVYPASQPVLGFKYYWSATSTGTFSEITGTDIVGGSASGGTLPTGTLPWYTNGTAINVKTLTTGNAAPPGADATATVTAFNGFYPMMWMACPPTNLVKVNGTLAVSNYNTLFQNMWTNARADPDGIWVNAQESVKTTNLTLGGGTPYYVVIDPAQQNQATANFRVARFTNPVTGSEVPVKVHPNVSQGTILALTMKLPGWYVPTAISNVVAVDACQDYIEIDYPPSAGSPKWTVEVRAFETVKLYIPGLFGALYAINNS